jgi:arsenite oxidase small subunit
LVGSVSGLTVGEPVAFEYPTGHAAILLKVEKPAELGSGGGADLVAYHVACPHMGCPIPATDTENLSKGILGPCPCHESTFDMCARGRQIYGRATQNLVRVLLEVQGDDVYATGVEGLPFGEPLRATT